MALLKNPLTNQQQLHMGAILVVGSAATVWLAKDSKTVEALFAAAATLLAATTVGFAK